MERVASLVRNYREVLEAAAAVTPARERSLCTLLLGELAALEQALDTSDSPKIQECLTRQQQLFGRSFLSGQAGEHAEVAFNLVARALGRAAT
jgi:hypothetical protein